MKLGLGTFTYPWAIGVPGHPPPRPLDALELCRRAVGFGVKVVQFADNLPLHRASTTQQDAVIAFARDHRLDLEVGTRGVHAGNLPSCLELSLRVGAPFVRLVIDSPGYEPDLAAAERDLAPHVARFRDAGLVLALENHDRFAAADLAQLVERLGPDATGITLDTVNSLGALEGPSVVVEALARYTVNLHLKDFTLRRVASQMGFVVEGCPAGHGRLDIPALLNRLAAARAGRPCVSAVLELWTPLQATLDATIALEHAWAGESLRSLRPLFHE